MATIESNFESICINPNDDLVLYEKEIIRSRIEKFLYAICSLDTDDLPTPLSRIEELYNCLVTGENIPTFTPLSRAEKFVMAMLGAYDVELLPTPISRSETLMKKIATGDNNLDDVDNLQSRYEFLLAYIIKAGGFNGGSPDDPIYYVNYPINSSVTTLYNTVEYPVKSAVLRGQTLVNLGGTYNKTDAPTWYSVFATQQEVKQGNVYYAIINNTGDGLMRLRYKTSDSVIKAVNPMSCEKFIFTATESDYLRIKNSDTISNCNGTFLLLNYQEGMENWDISYFVGIQSVKMPVLTTVGKNLFDGELKVGGLASNGAVDYNFSNRIVSYNFIPIKNNMQYKLSSADNLLLSRVCFYDNNKQIISESYTTDFVSPTNAKYLKFAFMNTENIESQIMLEEGSTASTYEPYKTNILTCNEEVELRSIGDIKDELNLLTGELTQRIQERVFDGSENWIIGGTGDKYIMFRCENYTDMVKSSNVITCDRYAYTKLNNATSNLNVTNSTTTGKICIVTSQKDLSIYNFKAKLNTDKPTIQYQLAEPIVKTVDLTTLDQDGKETELKTFDDITHVIVSSEGLVPTGDIDIARPIQFVDYSLDNSFTTLYNTIEYPVKNAVLRGQTLVNMSSLTGVTTLKPGDVIFIENAGMKINTTYTIMFNCSNVPSTNFVEIKTMMDNTQITQVQQNVSVGYNKFTIRTHTSKETNRFRFKNDTSSSTDFIFSELLILEGDYTNEGIHYFDDIASVKMPVLKATGKNLFYSTLEYGDFDNSTGITTNTSTSIIRTKEYNEILPNKTYRLTVFNARATLSTFYVHEYDNEFNYIKSTSSNVFTTHTNTKYVKFRFRKSDNAAFTKEELAALSCMITEGDTIPDTYEPYKSTTVTIDSDVLLTTEKDHFIVTENGSQIVLYNNEEVELRGIGDIKDELNLVTGELTQRIQEIVFDGSENWIIGGTGDNYKLFRCDSYTDMAKSSKNIVSDKYAYSTPNNASSNLNITYSTTTGKPCIATSQVDLSIDDFKSKLSVDKPRVQYQLATPIVKTVELTTVDQDNKETKLTTFDDVTHVTVSSEGLIPTGEIAVATKDATDVIDASVMSLRMDDILNSQGTLEGSANAQSDDIDVAMLGTTDIYEQLL